ncbi:hypothetical protein M9434_002300 [Picochlorum sp. BPE23]|nr:hypothetical protein M9434_002300 [Picochlorum sp. BPE23]
MDRTKGNGSVAVGDSSASDVSVGRKVTVVKAADDAEPNDEMIASVVTQVSKDDGSSPQVTKETEDGTGSLSWSARMKNMICCFGSDSIERYEGSDDGRDGRSALEVCRWPEPVLGPQHEEDVGKKTLILDLDETLVVLLTSSLGKYANPLLDLLDTNKIIRWRLFREACYPFEGSYVKDLQCMGRDPGSMILVDNSPHSYVFQPENAVPIGTFIDDMEDEELLDCLDTLLALEHAPDVRPTLAAVLQRKDIVVFGGYT